MPIDITQQSPHGKKVKGYISIASKMENHLARMEDSNVSPLNLFQNI